MNLLKIYTTPTCPWCHRAKAFLKEKNIPFQEFNVAADAKARKEIVKRSGQMGVPVIDIGGKIVVGFDSEQILKVVQQAVARREKGKTKEPKKSTPRRKGKRKRV